MHDFKWSFSSLNTGLTKQQHKFIIVPAIPVLFVSSLDQNVILGIIRFKLCVTKRYDRPK
jgi:hypothetical protein